MDSECPVCKFSFEDESSTTRLGHTLSVAAEDDQDLTIVTCPSCGTHLSEGAEDSFSLYAQTIDSQPKQFAHFELQRVLGQGGFGTVWLAKDTRLDRSVAVKLPVRRRGNSSSLVREAKTAAKLQHPNIVTVHEVGEFEGQVFIVCEYISGLDLRSFLSKGLPTEHQVVDLLKGIAAGLHHAHENQIVHRDIKPGNVLVDESGTPLVADFGLAKVVSVEESISSRGKVVGTILYMAPEQAGMELDSVDRRADIYAMGVMMYEMLTGERPYRGNVQAVLHQKTSEDPTPLRQLRPSIPRDLETICLKCLQRVPSRRYQTAVEFIAELDRFDRGVPILARPVSRPEKAWRWCQRNRLTASLSGLFLASLLIGLAGTTTFWLEARDQTQQANRSLYASQMTMAANHLGNGNIEATSQTLDRYRSSRLSYLQGFEWHYLAAKLKRFKAAARHGRRITGLAVSRDGDWFASIADDRFLRLFELDTAQQIREIPFQVGRWQAIAISHADNQLVAGAKDGSIYVWDSVSDTTKVPKIFKHGVGVRFVRFSGDGKRLFSSGISGAVRAWDVKTWTLISEIPTGREGLVALDTSHDGKVLATIGNEGVIRAWDVDSKQMKFTIRDGRPIKSVAVSPDGKHLLAGTRAGYLLMHEVSDGTSLMNLNTRFDWISGIRFLANTPLVALCSSKGIVGIFDTETQQEINSIQTHQGVEGFFDASKNGKRIVIGSSKGILRSIDTSDFQRATTIGGDDPVIDIHLLSSDQAVATYRDGSIKWLNFATRQTKSILKSADKKPLVSTSQNTSLIAIAQSNSPITLMTADGNIVTTIDTESSVSHLSLSRTGKLLVVCQKSGPLLGFSIDVSRDPIIKESFSIPLPTTSKATSTTTLDAAISTTTLDAKTATTVTAVSLSANEQEIAVTLSDNQLRIADLNQLQWLSDPISLDKEVGDVLLAKEKIIVGTRDGVLICFDRSSRQPLWRAKAHSTYTNDLCLIPGGNAVASVGDSSAIAIWDLENGDNRIRLANDEHQIFAIDVSDDGKTLVSGGIDGEARRWTTDQ